MTDKVFYLLIENFVDEPRQVLKDQVVASAFANRTCLAVCTLTTQEVLGLADDETMPDETDGNLNFTPAFLLATQ